MIKKKISKDSAFTLLELLLGLSIFAMIAVVIYSVFSGGINLSRRSEGQVEDYREARIALELLSRELENMVDYDFSASDKEKAAFVGEDDAISFIFPIDGKLTRVSYLLMPVKSTKVYETIIGQKTKKNVKLELSNTQRQDYALVRREQDFVEYLSGEPFDEKKDEVVLTGLKDNSLHFEFGFAEGEESITYSWKNEWALPGIPANIHVEFSMIDMEKENTAIIFKKDILVPHGVQGRISQ